jgi:competence protein ComEC
MSDTALGIGMANAAVANPTAAKAAGRSAVEPVGLTPWLPPAFGLGIGLYFLLRFEPAPAFAAAVLAAGFVLWALMRRSRWRPLALLFCAAALGFALAQARTANLATAMLERPVERVGMTGTVERIEHLPEGVRLLLRDVTFERAERLRWSSAAPPRVRVRLTKRSETPPVGARIELLANLYPFSGPIAPGAYDFRRDAFFKNIGATGYAISRSSLIETAPRDGFDSKVEALRETISARIALRLEGDVAAIAQALLTGEQTAISDAALTPFRNSGLSHIFSISGLHIGLATGIVFFTVRFLLALVPSIALRFNIKRAAAIAALSAAWAYTALVGFPIPAQRSAVMASLALLAICLDRDPFSLRVIALAAMAVLLFTPEALLNPSFQLSFAAVLGLIAGWKSLEPILSLRHAGRSWLRRFTFSLARTFVSSLIASLATLPFLIYHFHTAQFYAALANALALPLMGAVVMPATVATYFALPLGLDAVTLAILGQGLEWLLWIARTVADLPGASLPMAPLSLALLAAVTGLGLFLCIGPPRWRLIGCASAPLLAFGLASYEPPLLLVSEDGEDVAFRSTEGDLVMLQGKARSFLAEQWQGVMMASRVVMPENGAIDGVRCDGLGCVAMTSDGREIAVSFVPEALTEDCERAALVIAASLRTRKCDAPLVIDRATLRAGGAHAIRLTENGFEIDSAAARTGRRPWTGRAARETASRP